MRFENVKIGSRRVDIDTHPAADVFPLLTAAELDALVADVSKHGLRQRPTLDSGGARLIDGRNRLLACQQLGIDPEFEFLPNGTDAIAFVVSANIQRRHLTASQRALAAARISQLRQGRKQAGTEMTQGGAAQLLGVSDRSVRRARVVIENADPLLIRAVETGRVDLRNAERAAQLPGWKQRDIATDPARLNSARPPSTAELSRRFVRTSAELFALASTLGERKVLGGADVRSLERELAALVKQAKTGCGS